MKTVALIATSFLHDAWISALPASSPWSGIAWGIVLGIILLPVFGICLALVLILARMLKGWPFTARSTTK